MPGTPLLLALLLAAGIVHAAPAAEKTVCSITVNSSDEKEAFRRHLRPDRYRFVELVEKGRADWLQSACEKKVECDVLVVSGHFNAGDTFYSDRVGADEHLGIDELERASCSASCPALSRLTEVYLFGCESLNPDASRYSSSHGDGGRERMRRIFANVPVIYGFSGSAPVGPVAAALLDRYFRAEPNAIGSGRRSARLMETFASNGMTAMQGVSGSNPERVEICRFFDARNDAAQKLGLIHATLRREDLHANAFFERVEGLFAALSAAERDTGAFELALAEISADQATRARYVARLRAAEPVLRIRMIALAAKLGWLSLPQRDAEVLAVVNALLDRASLGATEVGLVCALGVEAAPATVSVPPARARSAAVSAALACLGDGDARARTLAALSSADESDVQIAQVYLRHRPVHDAGEVRAIARDIGRMRPTGAHVRALDTLGRLRIADREVVDELMRSFTRATSLEIQRAIAEVFLRADAKTIREAQLAGALARYRIASASGDDLIDLLIRRLVAGPTPAR